MTTTTVCWVDRRIMVHQTVLYQPFSVLCVAPILCDCRRNNTKGKRRIGRERLRVLMADQFDLIRYRQLRQDGIDGFVCEQREWQYWPIPPHQQKNRKRRLANKCARIHAYIHAAATIEKVRSHCNEGPIPCFVVVLCPTRPARTGTRTVRQRQKETTSGGHDGIGHLHYISLCKCISLNRILLLFLLILSLLLFSLLFIFLTGHIQSFLLRRSLLLVLRPSICRCIPMRIAPIWFEAVARRCCGKIRKTDDGRRLNRAPPPAVIMRR